MQVAPTWTKVAIFKGPLYDSGPGMPSAPAAPINEIRKTQDGAVWVATHGSGVWRLKDGKWEQFSFWLGPLGSPFAQSILEATDGAIWVTYDAWDGEAATVSEHLFYEGERSRFGSGVSRFRDGKWSQFSIDPPDKSHVFSIQKTMMSDDGSIWILSTQGVFTLKNELWVNTLPGSFRQLQIETRDSVWVAGKETLVHYHDGKIERVKSAGSKPIKYPWSLLKSADGSIWLTEHTLDDDSPYRYKDGEWTHWPGILSQWSKVLHPLWALKCGDTGCQREEWLPLLAMKDGSVWFDTAEEGLALFSRGEWRYFSYESIVSSALRSPGFAQPTDIVEADDASTWMILNNAIYRYNAGQWTRLAALDTVEKDFNGVRLLPSEDGSIWVISDKGKLIRKIANAQFKSVLSPLSMEPRKFMLEPGGIVWFGSSSGDVYRFKPSQGTLAVMQNRLQPRLVEFTLVVHSGRWDPAEWTLGYRFVGKSPEATYQNASFDANLVALVPVPESIVVDKQVKLDAHAQDLDGTVLYTGGISDLPITLHIEPSAPLSAEVFEVESSLAGELRSIKTVKLNGVDVSVEPTGSNAIRFLGNKPPMKGLNILQIAKVRYYVWLENNKIAHFEWPYKSSYAVLVAIDDYERKKDPKHRGTTHFGTLTKMVANAEALKSTLVDLGFPAENIITLYDDKAESVTVNSILQSFWTGESRSKADRLLFYFGGHGTKSPAGGGLLVTYDYDPQRPTSTSLLMADLTRRQSENIVAKHLLVALDACSSGLALATLGDDKATEDQSVLRQFRTLNAIDNDTNRRARNVLVAGTGDQDAIYDNGGVFTQALIRGLSGDADLNRDGIIEFKELANFVENEVVYEARLRSSNQTADDRKLGGAEGEMVFITKQGIAK